MLNKKIISMALVATVFLTTSCATSVHQSSEFDQQDKFETFNRAMFQVNYKLDKYVMIPVVKGYRKITTPFIRERVNNVFSNLLEPMTIANQALQGNFKQSATSLGRFAVNSTLGLAGSFDVAGAWGWEKDIKGFDTTLAKWCVPDGPYLVLPFVGPTTPRATASLLVDAYSEPVYWLAGNDANYKDKINIGLSSLAYVSLREKLVDLQEDIERNSVDYYAAMRTTYLQNRAKRNICINSDNTQADYDFDFGIEDEDFDMQEETSDNDQ